MDLPSSTGRGGKVDEKKMKNYKIETLESYFHSEKWASRKWNVGLSERGRGRGPFSTATNGFPSVQKSRGSNSNESGMEERKRAQTQGIPMQKQTNVPKGQRDGGKWTRLLNTDLMRPHKSLKESLYILLDSTWVFTQSRSVAALLLSKVFTFWLSVGTESLKSSHLSCFTSERKWVMPRPLMWFWSRGKIMKIGTNGVGVKVSTRRSHSETTERSHGHQPPTEAGDAKWIPWRWSECDVCWCWLGTQVFPSLQRVTYQEMRGLWRLSYLTMPIIIITIIIIMSIKTVSSWNRKPSTPWFSSGSSVGKSPKESARIPIPNWGWMEWRVEMFELGIKSFESSSSNAGIKMQINSGSPVLQEEVEIPNNRK